MLHFLLPVWSTIKAPLIAYLQSNKDARLRAEAEARKRQRQERLVPLYVALVNDEEDDEGAGSFPSFSEFVEIPIVKTFYDSDDYTFSPADWNAKHSEIMVAVATSRHRRKTRLFKTLVNALKEIETVTISPEVLEKISQAGYYDAITLTDEEMDPLFNLVTSRFTCPSCRQCHTYAKLLIHYASFHRTTTGIRNYGSHYQDWSSANTSEKLIIVCKRVIELSDLDKEEAEVTEAEFQSIENLGEVFKCSDCSTIKPRPGYSHYQFGSGSAPARVLTPYSSSALASSLSLFYFQVFR